MMKAKKVWSLIGKIVLGLLALCLIALVFFILVILPRPGILGGHDEKPFNYIKGMGIQKKTPSGILYTVNNSEATFQLDVAKPDRHSKQIFTNYAAALVYCREQGLPTIPSVQLIQGKLKAFDEALCITLELAIEERRLKVLKDLLTALQREGNMKAVVHVATALSLAGMDPKVEGETLHLVEAERHAFLQKPEARPCGYWDTDERLRKNYQSGRYLMEGISITNFPEACIVISKLLMNDPALKATLENVQAFDAKLTNPLQSVSFETLSTLTKQEVLQRFPRDARFSLFGYSTSKEEAILSSINIQPHEQLMPLLIKAIRSGKFSLEPKPDSGWYDYQWHALETLLMPEKGRESAKLRLSKAYQKRLENAFASLLTKERETHLKRLPMINVGCQSGGEDDPAPKVRIAPEFSAEPTLTLYLRLARGYRFLSQALKATLGEAEWARLRLASERPLDDELKQTMLFCYGLYERLSLEIGQPPLYLPDEVNAIDIEEARALFDRWRKGWQEDPAWLADTRVAVLVADRMTHCTYWGTAGVRLEPVVYKYVEKPNVSGSVEPVFVPCKTYLPTDFFFEFSRPSQTSLTRAEFRALCDKGEDVHALYKAFGGTPPSATSGPWLTIKDWLRAKWGWLVVIAFAILFWRVRRTRLWLGLGLLAVIICWGGLLVCSPYYRTLFIVRHVATINEGMGLICEEWAIPEISRFPCVKALSTLLVDADPQVRYLAARFIALKFSKNLFVELEDPLRAELKAHLLKAVEDPQPEIAYFAAWALRSCRDPDVVDGLINKLKASENYDELCRWLLHILGEIRDPRAVKAIYPLCEDPRRAIYHGAIFALGEFPKHEVLELLLELVKSQKSEVRYIALIVIRNRSRKWEGDALSDEQLHRKYDELFLERLQKRPLSFESRQAFAYWIKDEMLQLAARAFNLQEATSLAQTNGVLLAVAYRALPKQLHGLQEGERFNGIVTNSPVRLEMAEAVSRKDSVAVKQALIAVMTQSASAADPETRALAERLARTLQEEPKARVRRSSSPSQK
jgi:hypothetical protein